MAEATAQLTAALAGRYAIERELGAGGMATVYLAQDLKHDRKVAVKVLRPELAAVLGGERFVQEIKTTANLQHPHILPLFDSGEADGFLYYVMPFIGGETVRDKLDRETQLGIEEAVSITRDIADALDYAHRHNIIHRDIKPENILLHDGRPMVADFGIALAVSAAAGGRMTETGTSVGTPHYMSPEQATAEKDITHRSDVYSLGCVLYEMLAGEPPHTGASAQAVIMKIVTDTPRPVTDLRKSVPPNVADALEKALEKLAADRFESAAAFAEALTNPAFTLSTRAGVAAGAPAARVEQRRVIVGLAAVAVIALVAAVFGWMRSPGAVDQGVRRQRIVLAPEGAPGWFPGQVRFGSTIAPDGSAIVFTPDTTGDQALWIKERDQVMPVPLAGTNGGYAPFFSPDGEWIAFSTPGRLNKIARRGGAAIVLSDSGGSFAPGAWLDDGTIVFPSAQWDLLLRMPEEGGPTERILTSDDVNQSFFGLSALPDGRGVLVAGCVNIPCTSGDVWALDLETGEADRVVQNSGAAWYAETGHLVYATRNGGIFAAPFDRKSLAVDGTAIPVVDGVQVVFGFPEFQMGRGGTVLYAVGDAVLNTAYSEVVWVDRRGAATVVDTSWQLQTASNSGISLSPDGSHIAFTVSEDGGGIHNYVKRLPDGPVSKLTFEGTINVRPTWSPDGSEIMWASNRAGGMTVWRKRADGSQAATQVLSRDRPVWEAFWSPDGEWLIFRTDDLARGSGDILARRTSGDTSVVELVATNFEETAPALSPDGRWLAYASSESGIKQIYVRPFPEVSQARWQVSVNGGWEPVWADNGSELFFRDAEGMKVARYTAAPTFRVEAVRPLFPLTDAYLANDDNRFYAVSPDGQRFLMIRYLQVEINEDMAARPLILMENWYSELGRRE